MEYDILKRQTDGDLTHYRKGKLNLIQTDLYELLEVTVTDTPAVRLKDKGIYLKQQGGTFNMSDYFILSDKTAAKSGSGIIGIKIKSRIPQDVMTYTRKIMQVVYDLHRTESAVLITYSPVTRQFGIIIPKQKVNSAAVTVEPEDIDKPLLAGLKVAAFVHSHPFSGRAFLSGQDHAHAANLSYTPIMSINFNPSPLPVTGASTFYKYGVPECEFYDVPLEWEDLVEGLPDMISLTALERTEIQELIKDKVSHSGSVLGAHPHTFKAEDNRDKGKLKKGNKKAAGSVFTENEMIRNMFGGPGDPDLPFDTPGASCPGTEPKYIDETAGRYFDISYYGSPADCTVDGDSFERLGEILVHLEESPVISIFLTQEGIPQAVPVLQMPDESFIDTLEACGLYCSDLYDEFTETEEEGVRKDIIVKFFAGINAVLAAWLIKDTGTPSGLSVASPSDQEISLFMNSLYDTAYDEDVRESLLVSVDDWIHLIAEDILTRVEEIRSSEDLNGSYGVPLQQ